MNRKKGVLAVISGFSGAGKGTVVGKLAEKYEDYVVSISATTRAPREGEKEGVNYFYKTVEEFEEMIEKDELIEYAKYVDNYYGTPRDYVIEQLYLGNDVILEIEMQGALKVKERIPEVSLIFLTPPNAEALKDRLFQRGTETEEVIAKRMARAKEECAFMPSYDYIVINDDLDTCVEEIHSIIQAAHHTKSNSKALIERISQEFKSM